MKVLISACLLGQKCRYDGDTKENANVLKKFENDEVIPFCPEDPLFGTPRERISMILKKGKYRVIKDESKEDVTKLLEDESLKAIEKHDSFDMIVLKTKSPSCGLGTTPILNENRVHLKYGDGVSIKVLKEKYKDAIFVDEKNL
ncbi:MAG: DUF523 domain-containing protein [Helicobacteraceae bacterium]|nr:DUF523 domain-containing protein [Helicobacteraceae bacterium]